MNDQFLMYFKKSVSKLIEVSKSGTTKLTAIYWIIDNQEASLMVRLKIRSGKSNYTSITVKWKFWVWIYALIKNITKNHLN